MGRTDLSSIIMQRLQLDRSRILAGFIALVVYACGGLSDAPQIDYKPCWTDSLVDSDAVCGLLTVPGSYEAPGRPARQVAFAIKPPIEPTPEGKQIPAVFLIGGPGLSATYYSEIDGYQVHDVDFLNRDRDLILVDYRGLGESQPALDCDFSPELEDCRQKLNASGLGPEVRSAAIARDIDLLLEGLGQEKVVLYGESWGTRLALTMARDVPDRISHMVLDGVFPPEMGLRDDPMAALANLDYIATACEQNLACQEALGDVRAKIMTLGARWGEREDVADLVAGLSSVGHFPTAPLLAHELWTREVDEAAGMAAQLYSWTHEEFDPSPIDQAESFLMMITLICAEEANLLEAHGPLETAPFGFSGATLDLIVSHTFGAPVTPEEAVAVCDKLDVEAAPIREVEPIFSDIPTLLLSGGMDLDTSFKWGEIAASRLSKSQHLIFPFTGHVTALRNPCSRGIAGQFIQDPQVELDTRCHTEEVARSRALILGSDDVLGDIRLELSAAGSH